MIRSKWSRQKGVGGDPYRVDGIQVPVTDQVPGLHVVSEVDRDVEPLVEVRAVDDQRDQLEFRELPIDTSQNRAFRWRRATPPRRDWSRRARF